MTISDIPFHTMEGETQTLADYDGKAVLIVNVASRCGLAPQYETLERLQREYGDRGFQVLGFPSNQFLQELGSNEAIKEYCSLTYGISFPVLDRGARRTAARSTPSTRSSKKTPDADGKAGPRHAGTSRSSWCSARGARCFRFRPQTGARRPPGRSRPSRRACPAERPRRSEQLEHRSGRPQQRAVVRAASRAAGRRHLRPLTGSDRG